MTKYLNTGPYTTVDAIYTKPKTCIKDDENNIFIKALPDPIISQKKLAAYCANMIEKPNPDLSIEEKMLNVYSLRNIRIYLPFMHDIELQFYAGLCDSYRKRYLKDKNDEKILICNASSPATSGFTLIGNSGCGKSNAVDTILSHYPQVIRHEDKEKGINFSQIVYLFVEVEANSNFKALYENIGREIDKCLGEDIYYTEVSAIRSLHQKHDKICEYIETFGIGMIIFDEFQQMNFSYAQENSYNSLMVMNNKTKVAISAVGTEEVRRRMFKTIQISRRLGVEINASKYCENSDYFTLILQNIAKYNWCNQEIKITPEIVKTFYKYTKGIIALIINLYIDIQIYLLKYPKKIFNEKTIKAVANKNYKNLQGPLANLDSKEAQEEIQNLITMKNSVYGDQNVPTIDFTEAEIVAEDEQTMINNAVRSLEAIVDIPRDQLTSRCKKLLLDNAYSAKELVQIIAKQELNK